MKVPGTLSTERKTGANCHTDMRLLDAVVLLDTLKHIFPAGKQGGRLSACIMASKVLGVGGSYALLVKINKADWKFIPKILELIHEHGLSIKPKDDFWVIYSPNMHH